MYREETDISRYRKTGSRSMMRPQSNFFIDIFPAKTSNNIRDGKPSSGEFLPDSGKL
jgi:hypothetical protein